jgi:hypothetical protein
MMQSAQMMVWRLHMCKLKLWGMWTVRQAGLVSKVNVLQMSVPSLSKRMMCPSLDMFVPSASEFLVIIPILPLLILGSVERIVSQLTIASSKEVC